MKFPQYINFQNFLKKIRLLKNHFKHFCIGVQRFLFQTFLNLRWGRLIVLLFRKRENNSLRQTCLLRNPNKNLSLANYKQLKDLHEVHIILAKRAPEQ